jgi:hypothetical protein
MENGNGKVSFVCANRNGKQTFVFLGPQTINGQSAIAVSANVPNFGNM